MTKRGIIRVLLGGMIVTAVVLGSTMAADADAADVTKKLNVGLEVTFWKTLYHEARAGMVTPAPGESTVFEFVARYGF